MDEREELAMLRRLAELESKAKKSGATPNMPTNDPTEGMSTFDKVRAGIGKGFVDTGRGIGQMVGLVSRADVEEARKRDAALMNTGAGSFGNVIGNVAAIAPTAFIPGANKLTGSAAIGAVSGFAQPSTSNEETLTNTVLGAALGPLANVGGRVLGAGYQGAKALAAPFFAKGQERIAANTLQQFAQNPQAAAQAAAQAKSVIPGVQLTSAEASKDVGMAQLQRALQSADPTGFSGDLATRLQSNNAARVGALRSVAGDDEAMKAAIAARGDAAESLYGRAFSSDAMRRDVAASAQAARAPFRSVGLSGKSEDLATPGLRSLMNRPMFKDAAAKAVELAKNKGVMLDDPLQSLEGLHYIKLALDDMANPTAATAMGKNASGAVNDMRSLLADELAKVSPLYGNARQTFAEMSKPINQMEVGQRLLNQYTSATKDLSGNPQLRAEAFNRALRNEEQLVRQATGFKGNNSLADVLAPEQLSLIRAIADEGGLQASVAKAGMAPGSPTTQNLASQNMLRQLLGPTGLPESWAESTLLQSVMRPMQFAAKVGEPRITNRLAQAMLDPQDAARLLQLAEQRGLAQRAGNKLLPTLAPVAVGVANSKQ